MWSFSLINQKWYKIKFQFPIANNTMTAVFDSNRNLDNVFVDKKLKEEISSPLKFEGIYLF